ncbi:hypothetical protein AM500_23570 [Bacillus sp. FJAT-18017]|uniref:hypothetical protein n=1 Tax=Bacillus sp. FJAT-18017 TaxID=1705566 RepID=UPI0006AFD54F|nr:hypothetical protein [Bacillus sp. FJAT-18017]ALC92410.1 hypothetical protein AM500_23570 [Bacillus sp. FJAT-18017]
MLKKTLLIIVLLFLAISNKALADTHINPFLLNTTIEMASPQDSTPIAAKTKVLSEGETLPIQSFIIPVVAAVLIIGGLIFYWFYFRKKLV